MIRYVLDTNAIIELLRRKMSPISLRVRSHRADEIAIPIMAMHELYLGAFKSARREESLAKIRSLDFPIISFEERDARASAEIKSRSKEAVHRSVTTIC